jgi:hypothetical protein
MRRGRRRKIATAAGSALGVLVIVGGVIGGTAWLIGGDSPADRVADSVTSTFADQSSTTAAPSTTQAPPSTSTSTVTTIPSPATAIPLPSRTYLPWSDGASFEFVLHDAGGILLAGEPGRFALLTDAPGQSSGQPTVRHDLEGGIVYLDGEHLMWWQEGDETPRVVAENTAFETAALWQVVESNGRRAAAVGGYGSDDVTLYELETGDASAATTSDLRYGFVDFTYPIVSPDGSRRARIETGDRSSDLVIELTEGGELLRQTIASPEWFVRLHDFDGARVIVSREPFEPAIAPQVFFLYNLTCGDACTQRFYSQGGEAALIGEDPIVDGEYDEQYLTAACSAADLAALPTSQDGLPEAVAATRNAIAVAAAGCQMDMLWSLSSANPDFRLVSTHLGVPTWNPWHGQEAFIGPITRGARLTLDLPYRVNEDGSYTWPSFANAVSFDDLTADEQAALVEYYRAFGADDPEEKARNGFMEIEAYPEWEITISSDGTWQSLTRWLS